MEVVISSAFQAGFCNGTAGADLAAPLGGGALFEAVVVMIAGLRYQG